MLAPTRARTIRPVRCRSRGCNPPKNHTPALAGSVAPPGRRRGLHRVRQLSPGIVLRDRQLASALADTRGGSSPRAAALRSDAGASRASDGCPASSHRPDNTRTCPPRRCARPRTRRPWCRPSPATGSRTMARSAPLSETTAQTRPTCWAATSWGSLDRGRLRRAPAQRQSKVRGASWRHQPTPVEHGRVRDLRRRSGAPSICFARLAAGEGTAS